MAIDRADCANGLRLNTSCSGLLLSASLTPTAPPFRTQPYSPVGTHVELQNMPLLGGRGRVASDEPGLGRNMKSSREEKRMTSGFRRVRWNEVKQQPVGTSQRSGRGWTGAGRPPPHLKVAQEAEGDSSGLKTIGNVRAESAEGLKVAPGGRARLKVGPEASSGGGSFPAL